MIDEEYDKFLDSLPSQKQQIPSEIITALSPCCTLVFRFYPGSKRFVMKNCSVDRPLSSIIASSNEVFDSIVDSSFKAIESSIDVKSLRTTQFPLVALSRTNVIVIILEEICRSRTDLEMYCPIEDSIAPDSCNVCGCCKATLTHSDCDISPHNPLRVCANCNNLLTRN